MLSLSNILLTQFIAEISTTCDPTHRGLPAPSAQVDIHATTSCVASLQVRLK